MGTNYYTAGDPPCPCCGRGGEELHIGKSSFGWQFLIAPYPERGLTSFKAWREFLADKRIRDEYDEEVTLDELVKLVEAKQAEGMNSQNAPASAWGPGSRDCETADPEGYRFSTTADFC